MMTYDPKLAAVKILEKWKERGVFTMTNTIRIEHSLADGPPTKQWWKEVEHLALEAFVLTKKTLEHLREEVGHD
jgi:hypothetical protein